MEYGREKKRSLYAVAEDYFTYLGTHLPQQCASDEFYFLPRSEAAILHLNRLDDLSPDKIRDHIQYVRNLLGEIPPHMEKDMAGEIDGHLLRQSMESFIREFEGAAVWRRDPTLYVKIPLFAMDQAMSQEDKTLDQAREDLAQLLGQIPPFLSLGAKNLGSVSDISRQVGLDMTRDAVHFHLQDVRPFIEGRMGEDKGLFGKNQAAVDAWETYKRDLMNVPRRESFAVGAEGLEEMLGVNLDYSRPLHEILEIAQSTYRETREKLEVLAKSIDSSKVWSRILYETLPSVPSGHVFMELYQGEVQNLRRFFINQDILTIPSGEEVRVLQTPHYLRSLRATASYRSPLTGNTKGKGVFFLTPGEEDLGLIAAHAPYLCAHETYPGHHILDHYRIRHSNPIRRQIESPLFYEGWACYGEQLLDEAGYVPDPRRQLIGLKRRLWRSLRAILDVQLQTGGLTLAQAAKKIQDIGYSPPRARRQARRFALTPGYQLCYAMGIYEIIRLREQFSSRMGLKRFHDMLIQGGEMPFHLVEKRLEAKKHSSPLPLGRIQ